MVTLPAIPEKKAEALLSLPAFVTKSDAQLIAAARKVPGGYKVDVQDRVTAIVLLVGTRELTNPSLQVF
jgi:hypothetical protein